MIICKYAWTVLRIYRYSPTKDRRYKYAGKVIDPLLEIKMYPLSSESMTPFLEINCTLPNKVWLPTPDKLDPLLEIKTHSFSTKNGILQLKSIPSSRNCPPPPQWSCPPPRQWLYFWYYPPPILMGLYSVSEGHWDAHFVQLFTGKKHLPAKKRPQSLVLSKFFMLFISRLDNQPSKLVFLEELMIMMVYGAPELEACPTLKWYKKLSWRKQSVMAVQKLQSWQNCKCNWYHNRGTVLWLINYGSFSWAWRITIW